MNIESLLTSKKTSITQKWIDRVLDSYGAPEFFKKQKDRFANPIGTTISQNLPELYDVLIAEREIAAATKPLENIIKIRAVQDFTPSQAVSFVYLLKHIIREELAREKQGQTLGPGLAALEARIDQAALMAFDLYMECRERLHQIRINEILSGRSALTDGTKCISAMLKKDQNKSADNIEINRLT